MMLVFTASTFNMFSEIPSWISTLNGSAYLKLSFCFLAWDKAWSLQLLVNIIHGIRASIKNHSYKQFQKMSVFCVFVLYPKLYPSFQYTYLSQTRPKISLRTLSHSTLRNTTKKRSMFLWPSIDQSRSSQGDFYWWVISCLQAEKENKLCNFLRYVLHNNHSSFDLLFIHICRHCAA